MTHINERGNLTDRENMSVLCPVQTCDEASTKKQWDDVTQLVWPNAVPLAESIEARHLYADKEYICPACKLPSKLRYLVHDVRL